MEEVFPLRGIHPPMQPTVLPLAAALCTSKYGPSSYYNNTMKLWFLYKWADTEVQRTYLNLCSTQDLLYPSLTHTHTQTLVCVDHPFTGPQLLSSRQLTLIIWLMQEEKTLFLLKIPFVCLMPTWRAKTMSAAYSSVDMHAGGANFEKSRTHFIQ